MLKSCPGKQGIPLIVALVLFAASALTPSLFLLPRPNPSLLFRQHHHRIFCDLNISTGPYLRLPELGNNRYRRGLFNQWLTLHSALYASLHWTSETNGTVILPAYALSRKSFLQPLGGPNGLTEPDGFTLTPFADVFDVSHVIQFLRSSARLNACFPKHGFLSRLSYFETVSLPVRGQDDLAVDPGEPNSTYDSAVGYSPDSLINAYRNFTVGKHLARHVVVTFSDNFGASYVPKNVWDFYDPRLVNTRTAALSIRFNSDIRSMARDVIKELQNHAQAQVIGIHMRVEADWDTNEMTVHSRLQQYTREIQKIMYRSQVPHVFFVAMGDLHADMALIVSDWLATFGLQVFRKENFLSANQLASVSVEALAAVDAEILVSLDHFVGCAPSSFSYVVSEKRAYAGKPNTFIRKPGFWMWYPIYVPAYSPWRYLQDDHALTRRKRLT